MMPAAGAVGVGNGFGGAGREGLAGEHDAAAFMLFRQVRGDLRMVGVDIADEACHEPLGLQPAS